jgi:hypothetical protein
MKDREMRHTLLIAASILILAAPAFAQAPPASGAPKLLPGTRVSVLSTIRGTALNSANSPLPEVVVRLRDARSGRIVDTTKTDKDGLFVFRNVDPGSYVVELMNPANTTVLASSQIVYVSSGESGSAVVKLPFRLPAYTDALGNATSAAALFSTAAQAVIAAAAASNTVAQTIVGAPATVTNATNGR